MHLTRSKAVRALPLPRKGTKYIARALSHVNSGVPVVIGVRDAIGFAKTAREVRKMVNQGLIKINGRKVKDAREPVKLFGILTAGKNYILTVLPTGRFTFIETKDNTRLCKVIGKKTLKNKTTQINFHDGSNLMSKEKINIGDTAEMDFENNIKKIIPMEKGRIVFIISGRSVGLKGKIKEVDGRNVSVIFEDKREVWLNESHLIAI